MRGGERGGAQNESTVGSCGGAALGPANYKEKRPEIKLQLLLMEIQMRHKNECMLVFSLLLQGSLCLAAVL